MEYIEAFGTDLYTEEDLDIEKGGGKNGIFGEIRWVFISIIFCCYFYIVNRRDKLGLKDVFKI